MSCNIWDTTGQEKFNAMGFAFYRGAEACGLVFDLTDAASFERVAFWKSTFLENNQPANPESFPFILIGNKTDGARTVE